MLALGKMVGNAERAVATLADEGIDATLWDIRVAKPLDPAMIADAARHGAVVTAEDGIREGGVGALVLDAIDQVCRAEHRPAPRGRGAGRAGRFLAHGKPDHILARLGLDADGIARSVRAALA